MYFIIQCSSVFMERNLFQISELEKSFSLLYELVYFLYETRACQIGLTIRITWGTLKTCTASQTPSQTRSPESPG